MVREWLLRVTNAVVDLEVVPSVLESGIIVPGGVNLYGSYSYLRSSSEMYMCLFDLQKAFDSIEYPVMECRVRVDGQCSESFCVEVSGRPAGVCVVSCAVFGGDGSQLEESGIGLSVNVLLCLHADDIRILARSVLSSYGGAG